MSSLVKLVSGGETGVDRAALDAALAAGFPCGGWITSDRMAEDGVIPPRYPLTALPNGGYRQRTRLNVVDSDGTAIIFYETLRGGTRLTRNLCALLRRPHVLVDARRATETSEAAALIGDFVDEHAIKVLNIAGPRSSGWTEGYAFTLAVMGEVIRGKP